MSSVNFNVKIGKINSNQKGLATFKVDAEMHKQKIQKFQKQMQVKLSRNQLPTLFFELPSHIAKKHIPIIKDINQDDDKMKYTSLVNQNKTFHLLDMISPQSQQMKGILKKIQKVFSELTSLNNNFYLHGFIDGAEQLESKLRQYKDYPICALLANCSIQGKLDLDKKFYDLFCDLAKKVSPKFANSPMMGLIPLFQDFDFDLELQSISELNQQNLKKFSVFGEYRFPENMPDPEIIRELISSRQQMNLLFKDKCLNEINCSLDVHKMTIWIIGPKCIQKINFAKIDTILFSIFSKKYFILLQRNQLVSNCLYYNYKQQRIRTFSLIMASITCTLYTFLILSIVGLCLGITQLVLQIIFKYIGFTAFSYSLDTGCTDTYLLAKSTFMDKIVSTAFVGTCLGVLMDIIIFVAILLSVVSLRRLKTQIQTSPNKITQDRIQQLVEDIHSEKKYQLLYVPLAFSLLGQLITFGDYFTLYWQPMAQSCTFTYSSTDVMVLMIISGVWYILMLVFWIIYLKMSERYIEQQIIKNSSKNKYIQMHNVTNMTTQPLQNPAQLQRQRKQNLLLKSSQKKNSENIFENKSPNHNFYQRPLNSSSKNPQDIVLDDQASFKRGIMSSNIRNQRNQTNNLRNQQRNSGEQNQRRRPKIFNQSSSPNRQNPMFQRSNNSRSPNSPIDQRDINLKYNDSNNQSPNQYAQNRYNNRNRKNQQNTFGQLVYHKRFGGQSALKNQNNIRNGFETPSRFGQTLFKEQQKKYLNQNVRRSILPSEGVKQRDPSDSRKVAVGQTYYRNYQRSKYQQSPPDSRFKNSREGVLTNYIRGKYA